MAESRPILEEQFAVAMPIVERVVRQRFRVSLSRADDRAENERARECVQDALLLLLEKLRRVADGVDPAIDNVANYAARVAHNAVNEQLRSRMPDRARLKNRLRHLLHVESAFDTWEDRDGALLAGYSGWRLRQPRAAVTPVLQSELRTGTLLTPPWQHMKRDHWVALLTRVFDLAGGPLDLDDLLGCLGELLGVSTRPTESIDDDDLRDADRDDRLADDTLTPEETVVQVEELRRLWSCIRGLRREWLFAFLLNPPGLGDGRRRDAEASPHRGTLRGEIDVFPAHGVASIADISDLLALTPEQCLALQAELGGPVHTPADRPVPFHEIWRHLPLKDRVIGSLLGKTGGQVIALRVLAVRQLGGCLGARVRPEPPGHSGRPRSSASGKGA